MRATRPSNLSGTRADRTDVAGSLPEGHAADRGRVAEPTGVGSRRGRTARLLIALLVAAVGALLLSRAASAETLRFAKTFLPGTKDFNAVKNAAEKIRSVTEGRVEIEWQDVDLTSGASPDILGDLRAGRTQLAALPTMALADAVEEALPFGLPALFGSAADLGRVESALGGRLEAALEEQGLVTVGRVDRGFTYLLSVGALTAPGDLATARLWLPDGGAFGRLAEAIGAPTVSAPLPDVPKHLARARAGDESAANAIITWPTMAILQGWNEHLTDVLMLPMMPVDLRLVMSKAAFEGLSEADRGALKSELRRALDEIARTSAENDRAWPRILERFGARLHRPDDAALAAWRAWGAGVADRVVAERSRAKDMLRAIRAELGRSAAAEGGR